MVAIITTFGFASAGMTVKFLVKKRNFNPTTLAFSVFLCSNSIALIIGIFYWINFHFVFRCLIIGTFCGICNSLGIASLINALALGPAGPCTAIANSTAYLLFTVAEALINLRMLRALEILGFVFGICGVMAISAPQAIKRIF